jgi:transposase
MAVIHVEDGADAPVGSRVTKPRAINRGSLPKHLPRVEEVIEPESLIVLTADVCIASASMSPSV